MSRGWGSEGQGQSGAQRLSRAGRFAFLVVWLNASQRN